MTGELLKEKVLATRIPFNEIAMKIGVTAQSLNSTFKSMDVRSNTIEKIAQALDVDMSFFYPVKTQMTMSNNDDARYNTMTGNIECNGEIVQQLLELLRKKDEQIDRLIRANTSVHQDG